jgi:hypothetical protein
MPKLSKSDWLAVLRLAALWDMPRVRAHAIEQVSPLLTDPCERLALSETYDLPAWTVLALVALVDAPSPPGAVQLNALGGERLLKLVTLRERRLNHEGGLGKRHYDHWNTQSEVEQVFQLRSAPPTHQLKKAKGNSPTLMFVDGI